MPRRIKLYAGLGARLRYAITSNLAKWAGIGVLALAIIGAIVGSIPYLPAITERANAHIAEAGVFIRDDLTITRTLTPAHEDATALTARFGAYAQLRGHDACFAEAANIPTTQRREITLAQAHLKEAASGIWADPNTVANHRIELSNAWSNILSHEERESPGCAAALSAG